MDVVGNGTGSVEAATQIQESSANGETSAVSCQEPSTVVNEDSEENVPTEVSVVVSMMIPVEVSTINESEDPYAPNVLESFSSLSTAFADFYHVEHGLIHQFCTEIVALANLSWYSLSTEQIV